MKDNPYQHILDNYYLGETAVKHNKDQCTKCSQGKFVPLPDCPPIIYAGGISHAIGTKGRVVEGVCKKVNDAKLTDRSTRGERQRYIKVQKNDLYLHTPSPGHGEEACYWHANKRLTDEALHMLGKFMTVEVAKYNAYYLREDGVGEYLHHQFEKRQKDTPKANARLQTYTNMSTQELKQIKGDFTMQPFGHQRSEMTNMTKLKEATDGDKLSDKDKEMAIKQLVALSCSGYGGIGVGLPKTDTKELGEKTRQKAEKM
jgi:hypothetical protein